jgi:hypothetical protein
MICHDFPSRLAFDWARLRVQRMAAQIVSVRASQGDTLNSESTQKAFHKIVI